MMGQQVVTVTGNTFPIKDKLKAMGGRWNATKKGWDVPISVADQARKLVAAVEAQPKKELSKSDIIAMGVRKRGGKPGTCYSCGQPCKYPYDECWGCKEERDMGY